MSVMNGFRTELITKIVGFNAHAVVQAENKPLKYIQDLDLANESKIVYEERLKKAKYGEITTEIKKASKFYFAEEYHQQYLAKNPNGYCGIGGLGISCKI